MPAFHPLLVATSPLYRSADRGSESALHGLCTEDLPTEWEKNGLLGGAAWILCKLGLSVRGKHARVSAGRELHALFASEPLHVTASPTEGRVGSKPEYIFYIDITNEYCLNNLSDIYFAQMGECPQSFPIISTFLLHAYVFTIRFKTLNVHPVG